MILQFQGEYRWLSNFWPCIIEYKNLVYPSVEHFYVAMKTLDVNLREDIRLTDKAGDVKRMGKHIILRDDWDNIKLDVMRYAITKKYSINNPTLMNKLLATGDVYIQEGNTWNDTFWGVNLKTGIGENNLGKLIMEHREKLKELAYVGG